MTASCPYCQTDQVAIVRGRLVDHPASTRTTASCIGSGEPAAEILALNREHENLRRVTDRITRR